VDCGQKEWTGDFSSIDPYKMETKLKNSSGINAASKFDGNSILIIHILDLQTNDLIIKRL
jgi:hypothetical protein